MNARRASVMLLVVGSLTLGVGAVAAQNGGGRGPGPGTGTGGGAAGCALDGSCAALQTQMQMGNGFGAGTEDCPTVGDCLQQQAQAGSAIRQGGRWGNSNANAGQTGRFAAQSGVMTDEIAAAMTAGWLDEVHAQSAYAQLIEQFGEVVPFVMLQRAEAQHQAAWERQFERFGLAMPEVTAAPSLPEYASVAEACAAAVAIEQDNIGLYDDMLATFEGYPSLTQVATALRAASLEHHLPALEACAG